MKLYVFNEIFMYPMKLYVSNDFQEYLTESNVPRLRPKHRLRNSPRLRLKPRLRFRPRNSPRFRPRLRPKPRPKNLNFFIGYIKISLNT